MGEGTNGSRYGETVHSIESTFSLMSTRFCLALTIPEPYSGPCSTNHQVPRGQHHSIQNIKSPELLSPHNATHHRRRSVVDSDIAIVSIPDIGPISSLKQKFSVTELSTQVFFDTIESQGRSLLRFLHVRFECGWFEQALTILQFSLRKWIYHPHLRCGTYLRSSERSCRCTTPPCWSSMHPPLVGRSCRATNEQNSIGSWTLPSILP